MPIKPIAFGLALVCLIAGIVLIGMSINGKGSLLVVGLCVVVVGLGVGMAARAAKS